MHRSFQPKPCLGLHFRRPTVRPILLDRVQLLHECLPPPLPVFFRRVVTCQWTPCVDLEKVEVSCRVFCRIQSCLCKCRKKGWAEVYEECLPPLRREMDLMDVIVKV